jgi:hypothetical protein
MSTDRYLRLVLTIIAGCLVYLCVVLTPMPRAYAQGVVLRDPQDVYVVGYKYVDATGQLQQRTLNQYGLPVNTQ